MTAAGALVRLMMILIVAAALPCRGEDVVSGRWEGTAQIPGNELTVVVDLAQENGAWVGSIIIPGLGLKGVPLTDIKVQPPDVNFAVKGALGIQLKLRLDANNKLTGNFEQAGNRAPASLQKTGPPQVEYPPRNTPVAKELEGEWKGDYEMLGYTRHVSIKFANHPDGATAEFVIVGRKHNVLPVDLVTQEGDLVTVDSHEMGFSFEGRLREWKAYRRNSAGRDRNPTGFGTRKMTKKISGIVVLLATFCAATAIDAQSMFRGDAMHSGTYAGPAPRQFHRVKWKFPTGDRVISSPVFKDNVIYFGGDDGNVYAVDAATGRQIWKRATNGPVPATPAIADGTVYVGSYDGKFYAFNAQTGALKWKFAPTVSAGSKQKACTECNRRTRRLPTRLIFFSQVQLRRMAWFISAAETETFTRSIRPRAICVGNSKPAMLCTPRPRSQTAFCFSEAGTVISTPWTLRQEKRNGVSTEAKTR